MSGASKTTFYIIVAAVILLIFSICFYPVQSDDLYMYFAIARRYLTEGHFTQLDPFFYPIANYPWVILHQWLGYLIFYGVYKLGGFDLIILFKTLLYVIILTIPIFIFRVRERLSLLVWALASILALYASTFRLMERTSTFTDLFLVFVICLVLRETEKPSRLKFFLPLIFLMWVNIHPGFVLGWLVIGFYLLTNLKKYKDKNFRLFILIFGLSVIACFLNPEFLKGVLYPFSFVSNEVAVYKIYYHEWKSTLNPLFLKASHNYFIFAIIFLNAILLFLNRKHKSIIICLGLSIFFIYYGLSAIRFVPTMCFSLLAINLFLSQSLTIKLKSAILPTATVLVALIAIYNIAFGYATISGTRKVGLGEDTKFMPKDAVDFIDKNYPNLGNVFNTHVIGNYLSWRWDGKIKVFYHGFITDTNFFLKEYVPFFDPQAFDQQVAKYNIQCIIVDFYSVNRDFLEMVGTNPLWTMVYNDSNSAVFMKKPTIAP